MASRSKPNLRVFVAPNTFLRKPRVLTAIEDSFMVGSRPTDINFYGYVPKGENRYHLSQTEMMTLMTCVSEGLSWKRALRTAFSADPINGLMAYSHIPARQIKSGILYLNYLRNRGAKVSDVRNGICGSPLRRVEEAVTAIKTYQVKVAALEEGSGTGARRRSSTGNRARRRHA